MGIYRGRMGRKDSVIVLFTEDFDGSMKFRPNFEVIEKSFLRSIICPRVSRRPTAAASKRTRKVSEKSADIGKGKARDAHSSRAGASSGQIEIEIIGVAFDANPVLEV